MKFTRLFLYLVVEFFLVAGLLTAVLPPVTAASRRPAAAKDHPATSIPIENKPTVQPLVQSPMSAGGPDSFGYTWIDKGNPGGPNSDNNRWTEISSSGTATGLGDDDDTAVPIGYPFPFYDNNPFSLIFICANGYLTFTMANCDPVPRSGDEPVLYIAGWWSDLDPSCPNAEIYYQTVGSAPHRRFIVQYDNVGHFNDCTARATFQIVLHETSHAIEVLHKGTAVGDGTPHYVEISPNPGPPLTAHSALVVPGPDWGWLFLPPPQTNFGSGWICRSPLAAVPDQSSEIDTLTMNSAETVGEVEAFLNLPHTWISDLEIDLMHATSGVTVRLLDNVCSGNQQNIIGARFADGESAPVCGATFPEIAIDTPIRPSSPLTAFRGLPAGGDWWLRANDNGFGDVGSLMQWCLRVTPAQCWATPDDGTTVFVTSDAHALQQAVDAVPAGGTVKIAGSCTGMEERAGKWQTLYISRSVTLQGGYRPGDWSTHFSSAYTATLSAAGGNRVINIAAPAHVTLEDLAITGVNTTGTGHAIEQNQGVLTITSSTLFSNTSISNSALDNYLGQVNIIDSSVRHNSGGAIDMLAGRLTLHNTLFYSNTGYSALGLHNGSVATIENTTFRDNVTSYSGGAVYVDQFSTLTLTNALFVDNQATNRGGAVLVTLDGSLLINGADFVDNEAGDGGAVAIESNGRITIAEASFSNNRAGGYGGALFANLSTTLRISRTLFFGNDSSYGGALSIGTHSQASLENVLLQQNSASQLGGGLMAGTPVRLNNATFYSNTAVQLGGGVYFYIVSGQPVTVSNSIFWQNSDSNGKGATSQIKAPANPVNASYTLVQGGWPGTGNINVDPLFVDPDGADDISGTEDDLFLLQPASPAVDRANPAAFGSTACAAVDLRDVIRPIDGDGDANHRCDMGAYELVPLWLQGELSSRSSATLWWNSLLIPVYEVWRSEQPFHNYTWLADSSTLSYIETDGVADPNQNYFYEVRGPVYGISNRVGIFTFGLVPGQ